MGKAIIAQPRAPETPAPSTRVPNTLARELAAHHRRLLLWTPRSIVTGHNRYSTRQRTPTHLRRVATKPLHLPCQRRESNTHPRQRGHHWFSRPRRRGQELDSASRQTHVSPIIGVRANTGFWPVRELWADGDKHPRQEGRPRASPTPTRACDPLEAEVPTSQQA